MKKERVALDTVVGESSRAKREQKLSMIDVVETIQQKEIKKRTMFYLSLDAIEALDEIVFVRKREQGRNIKRSSINNSTVVEQLIMEAQKGSKL